MSQADFYPGKRLSLKSKRCTVRYIGPVTGKEGTWLGVEWDDSSRGKHAGIFEGKGYFSCLSSSSTAASFLRPNSAWDPPRSLLSALKEKYVATASDVTSLASETIVVGGKLVQEIGYGKIGQRQARLDGLENVILDGEKLASSPDDELLEGMCPNVRHLDLSRNLFESLDEVAGLVRRFPRLTSLVLDGNRLDWQRETDHILPFEQITSLNLNDLLLTLEELSRICNLFPCLSKLSASSNRLSTGAECLLPTTLQELNLSDNDFPDLQTVETMVRGCPNLYKLKLGSNRIASLNHSRRVVDFLSTLTSLDLSANEIADFAVIDAVPSTFPGLLHLQVLDNPLYIQPSPTGARYAQNELSMLVIARLPQLQTLNLSKITDKDRLQAEAFYLFQIGREISCVGEEEEASIVARHPRYSALCDEYGAPTIERKGAQIDDPNSLATRLTTCRLYAKEALGKQPPTRLEPLVLRLPKSLSIYAVLGEVGRRLGLQPMYFNLVWETGEQEVVPRARRRESIDWSDESDDEQKPVAEEWTDKEVVLVPSTRTLGTVVETNDAWIRIERIELPG